MPDLPPKLDPQAEFEHYRTRARAALLSPEEVAKIDPFGTLRRVVDRVTAPDLFWSAVAAAMHVPPSPTTVIEEAQHAVLILRAVHAAAPYGPVEDLHKALDAFHGALSTRASLPVMTEAHDLVIEAAEALRTFLDKNP